MQTVDWVDRRAYPFRDRYLDLPAGRMHYVDEGQGRPLVLVHGTPEWSFGYRRLIQGLAQDHRCVAADQLGFGLSDKPRGWSYLPEEHAENLTRLIEQLNLKDITLIVHDYGGPIGLSYAIDHPENVHSLVLMNTWMWSLAADPHFQQTRMFAGRLGRFLYERLAFSARVLLPRAMGDRSKLSGEIHQQYLRPWRTPEDRHGTWVLARELLGSSDWYDALWQKRACLEDKPALIVWGMKDFAFRAVELEKWKTVFPKAVVKTLPNVGHFVAEEMGDELTAIVADFLKTG